ncbi:hypothetical protein [Streptomyces albireticuli]|uniref:Uncharacterized protein n=1 Tax=Streptomyces albireticuli TaxID=1940 RepID=A0A2A2D9P3_9ACTN|nr:hypothetical protein [Streptomyces albireticuli]MCD9145047.1 hypothetical protein [Streptomyces albireticuli]MCD9164473.1 hypothetical protein [Streptomyces albireticuli]MCD9194184.1 hypothetical protein [Streptomyces albireticuli]PAU48032.1 hypothetical protein CK936_15525 [Streptomyces albireticuli]
MGVTDAGRVDIEIGELVLTGFDHLDHTVVAEVFRRELHRLVREHGVPVAGDTGLAVDLVHGLPPLPATASPHRLGTALARAVHTGLTRGGAGPDRATDRGRRT